MASLPASGSPPDDLPLNFFKAVPIFALPNVVLFPRAVLPLHIFEERYKTMTADALKGRRLMAMALLQPGWEKDYYARPAVDPVVCIGEILNHEQLPDGKYNFLLQGIIRAKIVREYDDQPYRIADLERLPETAVNEMDLADQRMRMTETLKADLHSSFPPHSNSCKCWPARCRRPISRT